MIIAIVGPTASGKTSIAIKLARKLKAEIISFDSLQVYKYLNIGTAKPGARELKAVKHHLINICRPDEEFNAGTFVRSAGQKIAEIEKRGKRVILVGGTGLYLKALLEGLCPAPPVDKALRGKLTRQANRYGKSYLYKKLLKIDPIAATKIHPNNLPRVIRALEIYYLTGQPFSVCHGQTKKPSYQARLIGLSWDRQVLYDRINRRVEDMFKKGLVRETRSILRKGFGPSLKPLQSLGYRQVHEYLAEKLTLPEVIELTKRDTRHYAKRQLSWFRGIKGVKWFHLSGNIDNKTLKMMIKYAKIKN